MKGVCCECQTVVAVAQTSLNALWDDRDEQAAQETQAEDPAASYAVLLHTVAGRTVGPACDGAGTAPQVLVQEGAQES